MNSNDNTSREPGLSLIYEYFTCIERQGPGSTETTLRALSFIDGLTDESEIADLGCGTGAMPHRPYSAPHPPSGHGKTDPGQRATQYNHNLS